MSRTRKATVALSVLLATGGGLVAIRAQAPRAPGPAPAPAPGLAQGLAARAIDLTYPFDERTIYWPTDQSFRWQKTKWGPSPGGYWYASATYGASEHGGTHLDSPIHFAEGQATTDAIPLSRLIGPAVVVDVRGACARDRDYRLSATDLDAWEAAHGAIPDGAIVLA
jgi:kynurenine formamidase